VQESESRGTATALQVFSLLALVADLGLLAAVGYQTLYVRPSLMKIFEDFDSELPVMTVWAISIPGVVYAAALVGVAALLIFKEIIVEQPAVRLVANLVAGLLLLAFGALFYLALTVPLTSLLQQLG
jgi:hypothetical protein